MSEIWTIYKEIWISAAHQLIGGGYEGKCKNLHGHNYKIEVWATSNTLNEQAMVINFDVIKDVVRPLDHAYLNEVMGYFRQLPDNVGSPQRVMEPLPTAERIAQWICNSLVATTKGKINFRVKVWETKTSYAEYFG